MASPNTTPQINVAFIGAGRMGREHVRAFSGLPGVGLAGLFSRTRARAELLANEHSLPTVCDSVDALYQATGADIVVVSVPELEANSVLKACFKYPWLILAEKPVGIDLDDALDIQLAAEAAGANALVGLNRRFLSSTMAAKRDLADDSSQRFIHVQDQQSFETARALGYPQAVIDNWMYGNSIHVIDYLRIFGRGDVTRVSAINPWCPETPGLVLTRIDFSSGDIGVYEGLWHAPGPWACTIVTARRRWELRPLEKAAFQNSGERSLNPVEVDQIDINFKPGFRRQAQAVVAAARHEANTVPDLDDATRTMRLINAIFKAT